MMRESERRAATADVALAAASPFAGAATPPAGFTFLASPYSHPDGTIRLQRYVGALDAAAWLLQQRLWAYSPIAHCHPIATRHGLGLDARSWWDFNSRMVTAAASITMLLMPGWSESEGMSMELRLAKQQQKPVFWLRPTPRGFDWLVRAPAAAGPTPFDAVWLAPEAPFPTSADGNP